MPRYAITERAGPFVAGIRNTGVGTVLALTERQAEHELRLGTLVWLPGAHEGAAAEPQADPAPVTPAPPELSTRPLSEQESDAPAPFRKQKRSVT
jgi:hypothetical protein